jgi:uncharacterized OB-fold protein
MAEDRPSLWVEREGGIALRGVHCADCGADIFPPQGYGCTACGAHGPPLAEVEFPAEGRLRTYAVVHVDRSRPTPFTVGELVLDAGPVLRVRLTDGAVARIGARLRGVLVERDGAPSLEFAPVQEDER